MDFNLNLTGISEEEKAQPLQKERVYDVLIVGGGPAAMTAAVYCMRKGVSTGLITDTFGGQVAETWSVENYMGYTYIEGIELVNKFREQVKQFEIGFSEGVRVKSITDGDVKKVLMEDGISYQGRTIIITTGKSSRKLNIPGEKELTGKGVAYCSTCDAPLFKGKKVAVVGGGNSGIESAIDLAKLAEKVTVIQFLDVLTADQVLIAALEKYHNVDIILEHEVTAIQGDTSVRSITIRDRKSNDERALAADGIFIEIGLIPNSSIAGDLLELNENGEIVVDCSCKTSRPGIFAAGDVTSVPFKQIIIAAGEGAKAALSACDYLLNRG